MLPEAFGEDLRWFINRRTFIALGAMAIGGCSPLMRGQNPEPTTYLAADADEGFKYIADVTGVWGTNYSKVESVALVTHLDGTGSAPPANDLRTQLLNEMKANDVANPNQVLESDDTSLVLVRGLMPPGIQKNEYYDLEVVVPARSKTTSLRGGFLMPTRLRPVALLGNSIKQGSVISTGTGSVLVDAVFGSTDKMAEVHGRILGGGRCLQGRELGIQVRDEAKSVRSTLMIANAINYRFDAFKGGAKTGVATPMNDRRVSLLVPRQYRVNLGRYLQVIGAIAYNQNESNRHMHLELLEQQLHEPIVSMQAAMKLEAIGDESVPILLRGLSSADPEIRFNAAEALAYLGRSEGAGVLEESAIQDSTVRWHAITALASMDDIEAGASLSNLLHANSVETRYAAFRAMHARSPNDPTIAGKMLGEFYMHPISSTGFPMLHFSKTKRPEVTIFNREQRISDNAIYVGTGLTIKSTGDGNCRVSRYSTGRGDENIVCSTRVEDVVIALAQVGVTYEQLLDIFRTLHRDQFLDSRLAINALPNPKRRYEADLSTGDSGGASAAGSTVRGGLPNLFSDYMEDADSDNAEEEIPAIANNPIDPPAKKSFWSKFTGIWKN